MSATEVTLEPRPAPVLIGDRLHALGSELAGGASTLLLVLALGAVFLVAGLRSTSVSFTDDGRQYSASCGVETVLVGSSWDSLEAACQDGSGLRLVAVAGGVVLLVGGLVRLGVAMVRQSDPDGPLRRVLGTLAGRVATSAAVAATLILIGATIVSRSRLDSAVLVGDCFAGTASCPDRTGAMEIVQLAAVVCILGCAAVLASLLLRPRTPMTTAALALVVVALLLLGLAVRPVAVEVGSGDGAIRAKCGIEVLLAGHPQPSVSDACRDARASRLALGGLGILAGAAAGILLWAGRPRTDGIARTRESPLDPTAIEVLR